MTTINDDLQASSLTRPDASQRIAVALFANGISRIAGGAAGAVVGFYLNFLVQQGRTVDVALVVGMLGIVLAGAELVSALPIGLLVDRFSARALLVVGSVLAAAATQVFGFTDAVVLFAIARSFQGFAAATSGPALLAFLTDATEDRKQARGKVMAYYELSLLGALAFGVVVGGVLWQWLGLGAFTVLALLYLVGGALFYWSTAQPRRDTASDNGHGLQEMLSAARDPLLRRMAPAWLAINVIIGIWLTHTSAQLTSARLVEGQFLVGQFNPPTAGFIFMVYAILFAIGAVAWGYALTWVPRLQALRISLLAFGAVCALIFLLNNSAGWPGWVRWSVVVFTGLLVIVQSGFTPAALAYLADVAGQTDGRGTAMGLYTLLLGLGGLVGAGLGGWLASEFAINGMLFGTGILLMLALASLTLLQDQRSPVQIATAVE